MPSRSQTPGPYLTASRQESPDLLRVLPLPPALPATRASPDHGPKSGTSGSQFIDNDFLLCPLARDYSPIRDDGDAQRKIARLQSQLRRSRTAYDQIELQYQSILEENQFLKLQASTATDSVKNERKQLRHGIHRAMYNIVMDEANSSMMKQDTSELDACKTEVDHLRKKLFDAHEELNHLRRAQILYKKNLKRISQKENAFKEKYHAREDPGKVVKDDAHHAWSKADSDNKTDLWLLQHQTPLGDELLHLEVSDFSHARSDALHEEGKNVGQSDLLELNGEINKQINSFSQQVAIPDTTSEAPGLSLDSSASKNSVGADLNVKGLSQKESQENYEPEEKSKARRASVTINALNAFTGFVYIDDANGCTPAPECVMRTSVNCNLPSDTLGDLEPDRQSSDPIMHVDASNTYSGWIHIDASNGYTEVASPSMVTPFRSNEVKTATAAAQTTLKVKPVVPQATSATQTPVSAMQFGLYSHIFEQLYQSFLNEFNEEQMSHWAFMELWAQKREFNLQAAKLQQSETSAAILIQRNWRRRRLYDDGDSMTGAHRSAFLMALEDKIQAETCDDLFEQQLEVMREGYDKAFVEAGGVRGKNGRACLSEEHRVRANEIKKMIAQLKEARPWQDRQTHGFETMGLDYLLAEAQKKNDKMKFEVERLALLAGGHAQIGKIKSRGRARVKSKRKYGNDCSCLNDCMRASIYFPDVGKLYDALEFIIRQEGNIRPNGELYFSDEDLRRDFYFLDIEDRVLNDCNGYRDVIMKMVVDGLVGELQLHLAPLIAAKKGGGHKIYETLRLAGEFLLESSIRGEARSVERLASLHNLSGDEARDKNGRTALHYCCYHGLTSCVTLLASEHSNEMYERGRRKRIANVWMGDSTGEEYGCLPVELALEMGHVHVVQRILKFMKERPPERKHRTHALRRFAERCILFWIDYAAGAVSIKKDQMMNQEEKETSKEGMEDEEDVEDNFDDDFDEFAEEEEKQLPVFKQLLDKGRHDDRKTWLDVGRLLLEVLAEHDKERDDESSRACAFVEERFRHAAKNGQTERLYAFFAMGVDYKGDSRDSDWTVLDLAIENRHVESAAAIAEFIGFDMAVNACRRPVSVTGNFTPCPSAHLYEAALHEDPLYARAAVAARADPNNEDDKTRNGKTPLMLFAAAGNMEFCKFLVQSGSLTTAEDKSWCRASFYARACGHLELQKYLLRIEGAAADHPVRPRDLFSDVGFSGCAGSLWRWVTEQSQGAEIADLLNRPAKTPFKPTALLIATRMACCAEDSGQIRTQDPQGQLVRALLLFKADPSIGDRDGVTPLHTAARSERMDIYGQFIKALEDLHGHQKAKVLVTRKLVDNMDETPELIVQEQELKKIGREYIDHEREARLVQFIFTFWCGWLKALHGMEWRGVLAMPGGVAKLKDKLEFAKKERERKSLLEEKDADSSDEEDGHPALLTEGEQAGDGIQPKMSKLKSKNFKEGNHALSTP
eukprot:gnl/MRDRNA2_/MRDRNA2_94669_c0_seq1.p1 gnl/MRDRNA2_/MRDRNA2_94669_c0~~gnl/MRDRNA2_/MRDRNA2_94669_c0_seq1.p1  ORF type:complete len:1494 (-),score=315.05 gnl/MRDRNA2_/MRDRNA2_94669_c0_seq1:35-4453(-)